MTQPKYVPKRQVSREIGSRGRRVYSEEKKAMAIFRNVYF